MSDIVQFGGTVRRIRASRERQHRPLWLIMSLLLGLAVTVTLAPAAKAAAAYSPPSDAWATTTMSGWRPMMAANPSSTVT